MLQATKKAPQDKAHRQDPPGQLATDGSRDQSSSFAGPSPPSMSHPQLGSSDNGSNGARQGPPANGNGQFQLARADSPTLGLPAARFEVDELLAALRAVDDGAIPKSHARSDSHQLQHVPASWIAPPRLTSKPDLPESPTPLFRRPTMSFTHTPQLSISTSSFARRDSSTTISTESSFPLSAQPSLCEPSVIIRSYAMDRRTTSDSSNVSNHNALLVPLDEDPTNVRLSRTETSATGTTNSSGNTSWSAKDAMKVAKAEAKA